jgi:hypothetical protein
MSATSLSPVAIVSVAGRRIVPVRAPQRRTRLVVSTILLAAIVSPTLPAFGQLAPPPEDIFKDGFDLPGPPPPNDTCQTAHLLTLSAPFNGTTTDATNDYDSGLETAGCTGYTQAGGDVAYSITLFSGQSITVTLSSVYATLDPSISLVGPGTGSVCTATPVTCLKGADVNGFGTGESFSYPVIQTGTYYIIVDSYYTGRGDNGTFTIEVTSP